MIRSFGFQPGYFNTTRYFTTSVALFRKTTSLLRISSNKGPNCSKAGSNRPTGIPAGPGGAGPGGATRSRLGLKAAQEAAAAAIRPEGQTVALSHQVANNVRGLNVAILSEESKKLRIEI